MRVISLLGIALGFVSFVYADQAQIEKTLQAAVPQLQIAAISESRLSGVYRVTDELGQVIYSDAKGDFFITGELYSTESGRLVNLTEAERQDKRAGLIAEIPAAQKVTFPASGDEKARITVFTDIDCGYCRKLHGEVAKMNELGITVDYLGFPRAGVGSESYDKLVSVWCSDDRLEAMNRAKAGKSNPSKTCENNVAESYALGGRLGVTGTPAIVLQDGSLVPGYVAADRLAKGLGI